MASSRLLRTPCPIMSCHVRLTLLLFCTFISLRSSAPLSKIKWPLRSRLRGRRFRGSGQTAQSSSIGDWRSTLTNTKWVLRSRPEGNFRASDLEMQTEEVNPNWLADNEVIIRVDTLAIEAWYRTKLDEEASRRSNVDIDLSPLDEEAYNTSVDIAAMVPALGIGQVIYSSTPKFKPGTFVTGMLGAQSIAQVPASGLLPFVMLPGTRRADILGIMGISGLTAWVGVSAVTKPPRRGETVVVSAAAGSVGSLAAQLAKLRGAKVIGIAGGPGECEYLLDTLKLDGTVDYKDSSVPLGEQLDVLAPEGIDFFFDNVGGEMLDRVLERIRPKGRVVISGAISQYGAEGNVNKGTVQGPKQYLKLAERDAQMIGYNFMSYMPAKLPAFLWHMLSLMWCNKIIMNETVVDGIEGFADAMEMMYTGGQIGKLLVKVRAA